MQANVLLAAALGAIALFAASHADACMPPPGPPQEAGESDAAYAARHAAWRAEQDAQHAAWLHQRQVTLWDEADAVFIARVTRVRPDFNDYLGETRQVSLRTERTLKGRRYNATFGLRYTDATSCGPLPAFAAIEGAVGERYVVFVRGGRPRQSTVQQTIALTDITDERIRAALEAAR